MPESINGTPPFTKTGAQALTGRARRGPLTLVLDFFSSVWLGVTLFVLIFLYASVGSAGIVVPTGGPADFSILGVPFRHEMVRQWRAFEMTEFEWFHTPFFNLLIALLCVNITVTTLRRIRLSVINLGVWMIHTGIVILAIGSVVYFVRKVEGDAPVIRRDVVIEVPGAPEPVRLAALQGNGVTVQGEGGSYRFSVSQIDPSWELLTGPDAGRRVFAVSIDVQSPGGSFSRQLLDGYPEFTEDFIPGRGRVRRLAEFEGRLLADDSIALGLAPRAQTHFWIRESAALYVRTAGTEQWFQRPVHGLPRYNDYVSSVTDDLWPAPLDRRGRSLRPDPLDITVPAGPAQDPLSESDVRITGYLRFAVMQDDWTPGGVVFNPFAEVMIETVAGGASRTLGLVAFDPEHRDALSGRLSFRWVEREEDIAALLAPAKYGLTLRLPEAGVEKRLEFTKADLAAPERPMEPIGETGIAYRVREVVERLPLSDNTTVTLLLVDFQTPEGEFTRWVFEDPTRNRDNHETAPEDPHRPGLPDPRIVTDFRSPPALATLTLVAGPREVGLRVLRRTEEGVVETTALRLGQRVEPIPGLALTVNRLITDAQRTSRPRIVPWRQRNRDAESAQTFSLVRVEVREAGKSTSHWLPLQRYVFDDDSEATPILTRHEPATITLPDGRRVEIAVGRERMRLPAPVLLDDFVLTTHIGGFTGRVSSIRDWTSELRFRTPEGYTQPMSVSTNNPKSLAGLWYFQAFWDAPQPGGSQGLAFTGLGIGNRHGVYTQLAGSVIAVIGMVYAFYVKPVLKRRRVQRVKTGIESGDYGERARRAAFAHEQPPDRSERPEEVTA